MSLKTFFANIKASEDYREFRESTFRDFYTGKILTKKFIRKQYLLLILLVGLTIFYTDNRYASEKQIAEINELKKQIKDAKYESLTISANLMEISKQSNIVSLLESKGIKLGHGSKPPVVIK